MAAWLIVLGVLTALVVYLLWMPVILYIDTAAGSYYLRFKGLATARILGDPVELVLVRLKVLFFHFTLYPLRWKVAKSGRRSSRMGDKGPTFKLSPKKVKALIRTFSTRRFLLNMDSGDFALNARLYPVFMLLNRMGGVWRINFRNENRLVWHMENRPVRIIKAIINP